MFNFQSPPGDIEKRDYADEKKAWEFSKSQLVKTRHALDIGGHMGAMSRMFAEHFTQVSTFEPSFHYWTELNTRDLPNVRVYPYGLGDEEKTETMYIMEKKTGGSTIVPHKAREKWMKLESTKTKTIDIKTLDSFEFINIDFIKIDVESYEYFVLNGALETLTNNSPVIMVEFLTKYEHPTKPSKHSHRLLDSLGYKHIKKFGYDNIYTRRT